MMNKIQPRWGILALAIVMFIVTMGVMTINGAKTSIYLLLWIMVGYYAYKARLSDIKILIKIVIFINVAVIALVMLIMDTGNLYGTILRGKNGLIMGMLVMLAPKLFLYFYCTKQLELTDKKTEEKIDESVSSAGSLNQLKASSFIKQENPALVKELLIEPALEDWNTAMEEYEGESRNKGLWAKLFAASNGNESEAKAQYLKIRASHISEENRQSQKSYKFEKYSDESNEMCIKNDAIEEMSIEFKFPVYKLANGNYAINYRNNFKIYSSIEYLQDAIDGFKRNELFSGTGLIGIYQKKFD